MESKHRLHILSSTDANISTAIANRGVPAKR